MQQRSDEISRPVYAPFGLPDTPAPWRDCLLALGPFLFLPVLILLGGTVARIPAWLGLPENDAIQNGLALVYYLLWHGMLVASVTRGLPRWSFPYWTFTLIISLFLVAGPLLGGETYPAWLIGLPYLLVVGFAGVWLGVQGRLLDLPKAVWRDWTLFSFAVYGFLPFLVLVSYDEVHGSGPYLAAWLAALAGGALFYMRSATTWQRALSLTAGFLLAWVPAAVHLAIYWTGRFGPETGMLQLSTGMIIYGAIILFLFLAPGLVQSLTRTWRSQAGKVSV